MREALARLEGRIADLEAVQQEAEATLANPALYQDFTHARPMSEALAAAKEELARLYADWEARALELERLPPGRRLPRDAKVKRGGAEPVTVATCPSLPLQTASSTRRDV